MTHGIIQADMMMSQIESGGSKKTAGFEVLRRWDVLRHKQLIVHEKLKRRHQE